MLNILSGKFTPSEGEYKNDKKNSFFAEKDKNKLNYNNKLLSNHSSQ